MSNEARALGLGDAHLRELHFEGTQLSIGDVSPAVDLTNNMLGYAFTLLDDCRLSFIVPYDWKIGTTMSVVARWAINEAYGLSNGEIQWRADYETIDQLAQIIGAGTTANLDSGDINIPATAMMMAHTVIGAIPATALARGDTVNLDIERIALTAGVDPAAEPILYTIVIQYTSIFVTPR